MQPNNNRNELETDQSYDSFLDQMLRQELPISQSNNTDQQMCQMTLVGLVFGRQDFSPKAMQVLASKDCDDNHQNCEFDSDYTEEFGCNNLSLCSVSMRLDDDSIAHFKGSEKACDGGLDDVCLGLAPTRHNSGISDLVDLGIDDLRLPFQRKQDHIDQSCYDFEDLSLKDPLVELRPNFTVKQAPFDQIASKSQQRQESKSVESCIQALNNDQNQKKTRKDAKLRSLANQKNNLNKIFKIKTIKTPPKREIIEGVKVYKCDQCDFVCEKSVSLGGHKSKSHPGGSSKYNHKVKIREERRQDRVFLEKAKAWYNENIGTARTENRQVINKIKKAMMNSEVLDRNNYLRQKDRKQA